MPLLRAVFLAGVLLLAASCPSPVPTESEQPGMQLGRLVGGGGGIQPMCVEGCLDPDPAPKAAGYFLPGAENQAAYCADGSIDLDQDGLDDNCEFTLALTFSPQMSFLIGDDVRREPRWAARWVGTDSVGILYMPSYYQDMGLPRGAALSDCNDRV